MTMESSPARGDGCSRSSPSCGGCRRCWRRRATNIQQPPRVFVERAIGHVPRRRGSPRAAICRSRSPTSRIRRCRRRCARRPDARARAIEQYATELETTVLPTATGSYAIGTANVEAQVSRRGADRHARGDAARDRRARAEEDAGGVHRDRGARGSEAARPLDVWRDVLNDHPEARRAGAGGAEDRRRAVRVHPRTPSRRSAGGRARRSSPPRRPTISGSRRCTRRRRSSRIRSRATTTSPTRRPTGRRSARTRGCRSSTTPTLADITAHEVAPGHYVHSLFMRRTPGKIRRIWIGLNPFPQPSSGQDGWAHYAEQLVSRRRLQARRSALPARADERGADAHLPPDLPACGCTAASGRSIGRRSSSRREAHLPAPAARQEAVRGTYDPTYGGYFLGKLAAFKLRRDVRGRARRARSTCASSTSG